MIEMLRNHLEKADLANSAVFADTVRKVMEVLDLRPEDVASALRVSTSTVRRWARGITSPHEEMREPIRRLALRIIQERV